MPNKIDITQTNAQLYNYITVWSGSNFTGPVRSVPIYNSSGTSSVAQAISDEYYLVRRGGEIIWAPIVSGGGSTLMFSLSPLTEESSNEPIGYFSAGKGILSDSFFFRDVERVFDFNRISRGRPYDSFFFRDVERIFDFNRIDIGTLNVITGQETEALAIYATPPRDVTFYDSIFRDNESLLFVRPSIGLSANTYFFNDSESISFLNIDKTTNSSGGIFV